MFCTKCGAKNEEGYKFCISCGNSHITSVSEISKKKKFWNIMKYVWIFILNFTTIGISIALFADSYDEFEIRVIAILIMIFTTIETHRTASGMSELKKVIFLNRNFSRIINLLGQEQDEIEKEDTAEVERTIKKATPKMYIKLVFCGILYLIAVINLLGTL